MGMRKKRACKRAFPVKTLKEKEGINSLEDGGLKLAWLNFIKAYLENGGNGTDAYQKAYPGTVYETAKAESSRLLTNPNIREEINDRLEAQCITDAFIVSNLKNISLRYKSGKMMAPSVRALEILAKIKGLMSDPPRYAFTDQKQENLTIEFR